MIFLVTKPLSLVKLSCTFGVRSFCIVILTWVELLRAAVSFHVNMIWRPMSWTFAVVSLPERVLTALQRERVLQMHLHELQNERENLVWDRKDLEERLRIAMKEYRIMEGVLAEIEEEYHLAIQKIEHLESELQDMKEENLQLKDVQSKGLWSFEYQGTSGKGINHDNKVDERYGIPCGIQSWKSSFNGSDIVLQDLVNHRYSFKDESKSKTESIVLMRTNLEVSGPSHTATPGPGISSRKKDMKEILCQRREVAVSQSLFSGVLSLLVGMIIWEAEEPCMPLVVALCTVVGMSLKSVVHFFSTIEDKPASDAVALLSFNWFLLGTLTYPMLPRIYCMLTPIASRLLKLTVSWLGFTY